MRPATMETKKACEMFLTSKYEASPAEMMAVIKECSKVHGQLTKEAAMGRPGHIQRVYRNVIVPQIQGRGSYADRI